MFFRSLSSNLLWIHQVIYPEGTRPLLPEGLPLKMGALSAAYQLQWPVQVGLEA